MKRLHLHIGVDKLGDSIKFYSTLFGAEPTKVKSDYAKWMLEDPRINFAISTRASKVGLDHLGLQVDESNELEAIRNRLQQADMNLLNEGETVCCYSKSDKSWVTDPSGIAWEAYQTMEDAQIFSLAKEGETACCAPQKTEEKTACCAPTNDGTSCC